MTFFQAERDIVTMQLRQRLAQIRERVLFDRHPIRRWEASRTGHKQGPAKPPRSGWRKFSPGQRWGGQDVTMWFRARVNVPKSMRGRPVSLFVRPGGESLCYLDGAPTQGLDGNRSEVRLTEKARGGETFAILLESYSNPRFKELHVFEEPYLATVDTVVRDFYWDARTACDVASVQPAGSQDALRMWEVIDRCLRMVDPQDDEDREAFDRLIRAAGRALRSGLKPFARSEGMGRLALIGHAHIDTAWLWPLRETKRKCGRTFATVLHYMRQYPEFRFSQSQPQLYAYMKEHYPSLYAEIKKRAKEGRWEPMGAGWVEQDSNMPSGESLVRQYLYGNRFFRSEFGVHSRTAWLPDAFGYPLCLPQILRKAGINTFVTTKIEWSQYNAFPYSLFRWRGLDGTEILSIMPPLNYNGAIRPNDCIEQWNRFKQKSHVEEVPFSFGWGDGGGGPTPEMIETGKRLGNIAGVPRCSFDTVQASLDRIHEQADWDRLPVYHDELYLELHRACQTTQARTKRNNRKCELLYRDAEFFGALASVDGGDAQQAKLLEGWHMLLTNQFHDILPGSSIGEVYDDADRDYAQVRTIGERARSVGLKRRLNRIDTRGPGRAVVVHNTLSHTRTDVAAIEVSKGLTKYKGVVDPDGVAVPAQRSADGRQLLFLARDVPPLGHAVYHLTEKDGATTEHTTKASRHRIENFRYDLRFDRTGAITSLTDKMNHREVISPGARANVLQLFEDRPAQHEAWDIDFNFEASMWEMDRVARAEVVESGPIRTVLRFEKKTDRSRLLQDVILYEQLPRIDFVTSVQWWEKRVLLKVAFPVNVRSRTATYEIQYGAIERATHQSTSWERARFENPGQRWIDLSEGDFGVSLLNDCKYGFDVRDNCLRMSLLRSPISPDPHADEGDHAFTYSLYPHKDDWRAGRTVLRAAELNVPLIVTPTTNHAGREGAVGSFASVDREHVVIDAVKKAEDSRHLIVRLYEAHGQRGPVTMRFGRKIKSAVECDLMEENDVPVEHDAETIRFSVRPFEIRTFKIRF